MVSVEFMGPIGVEKKTFDVKNLNELKAVLKEMPEVAKWLDISAIAINEVIANNIDQELKSGDRVVILPPVCGG